MSEVRDLNRSVILELVTQLNKLQSDLFYDTLATAYHADVVPEVLTDGYSEDLASAISELNSLAASYVTHIASVKSGAVCGAHKSADATNVLTAPDADDLATAETLANQLKQKYNLHRASGTYHKHADSTNVVTSDNAYDLLSLKILVNEIALDLAAHTQGALLSTAVVRIPG